MRLAFVIATEPRTPPSRAARVLLLFCCGAILWGLPAARSLAEPAVPPLSGRAVDDAGILSTATEATLEMLLARLERATGAQIAVLTVASLEGEPIETYALRVAETWELGSSERDDGGLLVVALEDRRARIEVGYGLEGALPDIVAGRIIREALVPHFRSGDFDAGVLVGVQKIAERLAPGEAWLELEARAETREPAADALPSEAGSRRATPLPAERPPVNWELFRVWVVFFLLMPLIGALYALFSKDAETRGIAFGGLLIPILLGGSLATDELGRFPSDSGKFLLGGAAAVILFSALFWGLHLRLRKWPEIQERWRQRLDALADGRILFRAGPKSGAAAPESKARRRWLRRITVAAIYLAIGGSIARLWHPGYAVLYFHNLFWLFVIYRSALHPSPSSSTARSWSGRAASRRPVTAPSWTSRPSVSSGRWRGGGGSFGGGGASGSW